jgi:hypothetical protein
VAPVKLAPVRDHIEGLLARAPALDLDLLALELLVDGEEVRDLALQRLGDVVEGFGRIPARIVGGNANDLVVLALLVAHHEQRDRLDRDHAPREGGLGDADHRIERISVAAVVSDQIAVVGRVNHRGGEEAVEDHGPDPLVVLVLVAAPLGDLDEGEQLVGELVVSHHRQGYPARLDVKGRCVAGGRPRRTRPRGLRRRRC